MASRTVLLVEDDRAMATILARLIQPLDVKVDVVYGGREALEKLEARPYDVVVTDLMMPDYDGMDVLKAAKARGGVKGVVLVTAAASVPLAVEAMRLGAADFLTKPVDKETLHATLGRLLDTNKTAEEASREWRHEHAPELIGNNVKLLDTLTIIERVSSLDCTVLITGASGTGKELCARALHHGGSRRKQPFVAVNCAAIPKDLIESELFGHAKGAFSGATERREGKFVAADGGTLFLDEIGEMHLDLQAKLLRVLQDKEVTAVGDAKARKVDVRIVAATNRDLTDRIESGSFREDLYYRLNVMPLGLPSLNERLDDLPLLTAHFIKWANQRHNRAIAGVEPEVMMAFQAYTWKGNVRELQNVVERLVILAKDTHITLAELPPQMRAAVPAAAPAPAIALPATTDVTPRFAAAISVSPPMQAEPEPGVPLDKALEALERKLTLDALQRSGGNKAKAAEILGLKRTTLVERLKKLAIVDPV